MCVYMYIRNMGEELADEGDHVGAIAAIAQTKIITQVRERNWFFLCVHVMCVQV